MKKTGTVAHGAPLTSVPEQSESSSDMPQQEEERAEEPFEATIIRLDGRTLELLFRQAGE